MPIDYTPPVGPLPFEFTTQGYTSPADILFNFKAKGSFGDLRAAVNVMQVDPNPTYSYVKSCPKYVIGYNSGAIQIMYGKCLYGGIRSLQSAIHAYDSKELGATINVHNPVDLSAFIEAKDRGVSLFVTIHGYDSSYLGVSMKGGHSPVDLYAGIFVRQTTSRDLNALITVWHARYLQASINVLSAWDLSAEISLIRPGELSAYLNIISVNDLLAFIYSWGIKDLNAYLNTMFAYNLKASVHGRDDMYKNLSARLKGYASEFLDLSAIIGGMTFSDLPTSIRATYFRNLSAFLYPVQPKDLHASIMVLHAKDLQGLIIGDNYPFYLTASINSIGIFNDLHATIASIRSYGNLKGLINSYEMWYLGASITAATSNILTAYLNVIGNSRSLSASIYPKMIRLTTIVKVATMEHSDISAVINATCSYSTYGNLQASIDVKYKSDLYAYVKVIQIYEAKNLLAKIGYTDSYTTLDKLKLSINIFPTLYYTTDRLKLNIEFLNAQTLLGASIRGTLRYTSLGASISAVKIPMFTYTDPIKNRETVIEKTYDGVFKSFQTVEMSFKSIVEEYYYSQSGESVWKSSKFDKWMLNVSGYLPADTSLGLKRRLHRATTLYDLKKFSSVDEAIKFAIDYVTAYPQKDLVATIKGIGWHSLLGGSIVPLYNQTTESSLNSSITPISNTVIYDYYGGQIEKI